MSGDPERRLLLAYAPARARDGLAALLALDDRLGETVRTTREPALGQMRLLWWREALAGLDAGTPPAEPVLAALAAHALPTLTGAALAEMLDGWDVLIEAETLDAEALDAYSAARGARLFALAGALVGAAASDRLALAGRGWALADLARNLADADEAAAAKTRARDLLAAATAVPWSRRARSLGAMAVLAQRDLDLPPGSPPPVGAPSRLARLLWHRFTGR